MEKKQQLNFFDNDIDKSWYNKKFLSIDVETTGLNNKIDRVIEIAWIIFHKEKILTKKNYLFNVGRNLPDIITKITGISDDMLKDKPNFSICIDELLLDINKVDFLVAYNAQFDRDFINSEFSRLNKSIPEKQWVDPYIFIKKIDRYKKGKKLTDVSKRWGVRLNNAHRALSDSQATGELLYLMKEKINLLTLNDLIKKQNEFKGKQEEDYKNYKNLLANK